MAQSNAQCRIELRELSLLGAASHQFWVRYDENGNVVSEIHGLATDRQTGVPKAVGTDSDSIRIHVFNSPHLSDFIREGQFHKVMIRGDESAIEARWANALKAKDLLNTKDLNYIMFPAPGCGSGNSNSVAKTIGDMMGFNVEQLSQRIIPGAEINLLPTETHQDLYHVWPEVQSEPKVMGGDGECTIS